MLIVLFANRLFFRRFSRRLFGGRSLSRSGGRRGGGWVLLFRLRRFFAVAAGEDEEQHHQHQLRDDAQRNRKVADLLLAPLDLGATMVGGRCFDWRGGDRWRGARQVDGDCWLASIIRRGGRPHRGDFRHRLRAKFHV